MSENKSQLVVIGAGPGGYAAAFYAADLGMQVIVIDPEKNPGGVCLHRGCIPSKALLHIAKLIHESQESAAWGVTFQPPEIDVDKMRAFKDKVVAQLTGGTGQLLKARKINHIRGYAKFKNNSTLQLTDLDGKESDLAFEKCIIATGSRPAVIPGISIDSPRVMDSTGALAMPDIPERLLIVGGGYIGLEMGTVYSSLGSQVSVVEMMPGLLPGADRDLARVLQKSVTPKFKEIMLETKVVSVEDTGKSVKVQFEGENISEPVQEFDRIIISIGRRPNSENIGLENTKIVVSKRGFVEVDETRRTAEANIWAIGDIAGDPMLAHKASHEGHVAVEAILGEKVAFEPAAIPAVVFTDPELAWAGVTETEAKEQGLDVEITRFPWAASGRAMTMERTDGLTKLIFDKETKRILGIGLVGAGAGEMISEGTLAIEMAATAEDLKLTIHPHPTLSETVMEAAEMIFGTSTHVYRPKRK